MNFLQPLALLGLAAGAIPALLHLLQRREPPTVPFPPVRYLAETERRHSRRLRLRHLLLLLLRTAVIVLVVLAAARPVARVPLGGGHAPSALALVLDNSLSAGAVTEGRPVVTRLADAARTVVDAIGGNDHLWIVPADGVPRRMGRTDALTYLASVEAQPVRLDLGDAIRAAARLAADDALPGTVVVLSDLQQSALSPGDPVRVPVLVAPPPPPPANRWIDSVAVTPAVWTPAGAVVAAVEGSEGGPAELLLLLGDAPLARGLAAPGERVGLTATLPGPGWHAARLQLAADELRSDNTVHLALWAAPPMPVTVGGGAGAFVADAVDVLRSAGRVGEGRDVTLDDRPAAGATVVFPPLDPALTGAVNRQLEARGVSWRYGPPEEGEWRLLSDVAGLAGTAVTRRHGLTGTGAVLATAGGSPWLVQAGDVILVASRMDPAWTALPVSAGFVPFLDQLLTRIAAGRALRVRAVAGAPATLPPAASAVVGPGGRIAVPSDGRIAAPAAPGVYFLLGAGGDTVGALEVNYDARESPLAAADRRTLTALLGPRVEMVPAERLAGAAFAGARRADLTTALLVLAAVLALAELAVATLGGRASAD